MFFFPLTALLTSVASAAILPSGVPNQVFAPMNPPTNMTAQGVRCIVPTGPPYYPVSRATCRQTFDLLLNAPDVDVQSRYHRWNSGPIQFTSAPCALSVDAATSSAGPLIISKRQIVEWAWTILAMCAQYGQGGWAPVKNNVDWIAIVEESANSPLLAS